MAQTLEELVLRLSMDSKRLQRELRTVQTKNRTAATRMERVWRKASHGVAAYTKRLVSVRGALAAIASATAAGYAIKRTLDFADAIEKTASKLGISIEALQEFQFAAQQSGVPLNTANMALQRFTRRAAEAAIGTGEARDAIAELGLQLTNSNGKIRKTEDLFRDVVMALSEVESPAVQLRLAFKLFDSEGVAVVNMARNFAELTARARETGAVIDGDVIRQASRAKMELDAMASVAKAKLVPALVAVFPWLIKTAEALSDVAEWTGKVTAKFQDVSNIAANQLAAELARTRAEYEFVQDELRRFIEVLSTGGVLSQDAIGRFTTGARENLGLLSKRMAELQSRIESLGEATKSAPPIVPPPEEIEPLTEALEEYNEVLTEVATTAERKATDIEQAWTGLQGDLSDGFARLAIDGETSFKQIGQSFLREVVATIIRSQVLGTLMSFFGGASSAAIGGSSTYSGPFASQFNPPAVGSGVLIPGHGVLARHAGGPVSPGRSYLVGERGPELIKPRSPGMVVPNNALGGGGGISVVVHNYSNEPVETQDNDGPSKKELEIFIGQAASKSVLRGGDLSQAISSRFGSKPVGRSGA